MLTHLIKRNGETEEFIPSKPNGWGEWSAKNLGARVDWPEIVIGAVRKLPNYCTTEELHTAMIRECLDKEDMAHNRMAGRLLISGMYKKVFNAKKNSQLPTLKAVHQKLISLGYMVYLDYSDDEYKTLERIIDHNLDLKATYGEINQITSKYCIQDRVNKVLYETPQFMYMRMAMALAERHPSNVRIKNVIGYYNHFSRKRINAPTPNHINLGTPLRAYASCCVVTTDDSAESLAAADHIAYIMTCASAGQGGHLKTRSHGDPVRGGVIRHQGKLPYYRHQQTAVTANLQNGRGGALTMHFTSSDPEVETLLALKNPMTVAAKKVDEIDYSFGTNRYFAEHVRLNKDWMLFSYNDAPELYELQYGKDQDAYIAAYEAYKANPLTRKSFVSARKLIIRSLTEAYETGTSYLHWTDEMNRHTPFKEAIYSSNLCQEIGLVTRGFRNVAELYKEVYEEGDGEIGLCNLAAICLGNMNEAGKTEDEVYEDVAYYSLMMVDDVIDLMEYPFPNLRNTATRRRSAGIGITNLAYEMARHGFKYDTQEGRNHIHFCAERHSYYLHKASLRLAKERGNAEWMHKTRYPDGWLPIDTYNKNVDELVTVGLAYDWETLRAEIIEQGGIRNSVLEAHMPVESSSGASGSANSLYPIREGVLIKTNETSVNVFVAPDWDNLKDQYQIAWDIDTLHLIEDYAIVQKFTGQGISADWYYKYRARGEKVGTRKLVREYLHATYYGAKSRYYQNSAVGVITVNGVEQVYEEQAEAKCGDGGCVL